MAANVQRLMASVGRGGRNLAADVRLVQGLLNRRATSVEPLLPVDGIIGPKTIGAIRTFQRLRLGIAHPDERVDPGGRTFRMLCDDVARMPAAPTPITNLWTVAPTGPYPAFATTTPLQFDAFAFAPAATIAQTPPAAASGERKVAWGAKVSAEFKARVIEICAGLEIDPDLLMSCMAFESGETFSASTLNAAGSGAVGLIQFMPSTAKGLGTTTDDLAKMTAVAQLDYVEKYFSRYKGKITSIEDIYMVILYPVAVGKGADHVLFVKDGAKPKNYSQNAGLDTNKDGNITVGEAAAKVRAKYEKGLKEGYIG